MAFSYGMTHDISRAASQRCHVLQDYQLVLDSFPAYGMFPGDTGTVNKPECSFDATANEYEA